MKHDLVAEQQMTAARIVEAAQREFDAKLLYTAWFGLGIDFSPLVALPRRRGSVPSARMPKTSIASGLARSSEQGVKVWQPRADTSTTDGLWGSGSGRRGSGGGSVDKRTDAITGNSEAMTGSQYQSAGHDTSTSFENVHRHVPARAVFQARESARAYLRKVRVQQIFNLEENLRAQGDLFDSDESGDDESSEDEAQDEGGAPGATEEEHAPDDDSESMLDDVSALLSPETTSVTSSSDRRTRVQNRAQRMAKWRKLLTAEDDTFYGHLRVAQSDLSSLSESFASSIQASEEQNSGSRCLSGDEALPKKLPSARKIAWSMPYYAVAPEGFSAHPSGNRTDLAARVLHESAYATCSSELTRRSNALYDHLFEPSLAEYELHAREKELAKIESEELELLSKQLTKQVDNVRRRTSPVASVRSGAVVRGWRNRHQQQKCKLTMPWLPLQWSTRSAMSADADENLQQDAHKLVDHFKQLAAQRRRLHCEVSRELESKINKQRQQRRRILGLSEAGFRLPRRTMPSGSGKARQESGIPGAPLCSEFARTWKQLADCALELCDVTPVSCVHVPVADAAEDYDGLDEDGFEDEQCAAVPPRMAPSGSTRLPKALRNGGTTQTNWASANPALLRKRYDLLPQPTPKGFLDLFVLLKQPERRCR